MGSLPHLGKMIIPLAVGGRFALAIQGDLRASYQLGPGAVLEPHGSRNGSIVLMKVRERAVAQLMAQTNFPNWSYLAGGRNCLEHGERSNQFRGTGKTTPVADSLQNRGALLSEEAVLIVVGIQLQDLA